MKKLLASLCIILSLNTFGAPQEFIARPEVQNFINKLVKKNNFKRQELVNTFKKVQLQPEIIKKIKKPYEKKPWYIYKKLFINQKRLDNGMKFWDQNKVVLNKVSNEFGVPAEIIVAIIGIETLYGKHVGNYRVIDSLTTLAFNYPKRARFFKRELENYLLLCRENNRSFFYYYGSYAGAIGKPQFMPSSYRAYAVGYNKKTSDLLGNNNDVIKSVANYFKKHGWQTHQGIAQEAVVKNNAAKKINTSLKKASYSLKKLKKLGITPKTKAINNPKKAGVIEFQLKDGVQFWLTYPNFYVITRYNSSPLYALAVYILSQQLKHKWQTEHLAHSYA